MKLSLSNGIFCKLGIQENFAAIKQLGFENIEFNMKTVRKEHDTDVYREQKALAASGLNCLTLHSASLYIKDPIEVHQAVYYGKISLECARALKAPIMTIHSNVSKKLATRTMKQCLMDVFGEIKPFAKKLGIKLALENLSHTSTGVGENVEQLEKVLDVIDPKEEIGITFDFCHALETGEVDNLLRAYGKRICNVHMANRDHRPLMKRTPELTHFLSRLQDWGYSGPITLELKHQTYIKDIAKTKIFFEKILKEY